MLFRYKETISTVRLFFFRKVATEQNFSVLGLRERHFR
jgi:hypothetical protein